MSLSEHQEMCRWGDDEPSTTTGSSRPAEPASLAAPSSAAGTAAVANVNLFASSSSSSSLTRQHQQQSLAQDYAAIALLVQQLDGQVARFTQNAEQVAHETAPIYAGLTTLWLQHGQALRSHQQPPLPTTKGTRNDGDDRNKGESKGKKPVSSSGKNLAATVAMDGLLPREPGEEDGDDSVLLI